MLLGVGVVEVGKGGKGEIWKSRDCGKGSVVAEVYCILYVGLSIVGLVLRLRSK